MRTALLYKLCGYLSLLLLVCCLAACSEEETKSEGKTKVTVSKENTKSGLKITGTLEVEIQEPTFEAKEEHVEKFVAPAQSTSPLDF